jgi:hypothetical protein
MPCEINKRFVQSFFEQLAKAFKGEEADPGAFLSEDIRWWLPKSIEKVVGVATVLCGRSEVMAVLSGVKDTYIPETTAFKFHSWIAEGDLVALRFSLSAKTINGKLYENQYQSTVRCSGGMIAEIWESFDTAYLEGLLKK